MPITFVKPELQSNEAFKSFEDNDSLGAAYLDLSTKVSTGSLDLLPEDMRKDPAITRYKSVSDLARGLVETQKMVGSIEKAPEKAEGYKFTPVQNIHASLKTENILKELMPMFHAAGAGNKLADTIQQGLLQKLSSIALQRENSAKEASVQTQTALKGEWGADYDARMDKLDRTWKSVGGIGNVKETSLDNIKALSKLVGFISEDTLGKIGEQPPGPITDATVAQKEIDKYSQEITTKGKSHPYWNDKDPGHEEALKKMHDLHKLLEKK